MNITDDITATAPAYRKLADLVTERPALARSFELLGLDYCCRGQRTLAEACRDDGVDIATALEALATGGPAGPSEDWPALGAGALCEHIVSVHHRYLYSELPVLGALAEKVLGRHGEVHPELRDVAQLVPALQADMFPHLAKEERVLFPAINALEAGVAVFGRATVAGPISVMTAEHESVGDLLRRLRGRTDGYAVPEDGCASYRLLYERLEALETDTHLHILKENSFLFPAAVALEAELDGEE